MNLVRLTLCASAGLLVASCASKKPAYRDASGQTIGSAEQYQYANEPQSARNAPRQPQGFLPPEQLPWPKMFVSDGITNVIYQPTIEKWDGTALSARNAVAVQAQGGAQPIYGVIQTRATTSVDKTSGTVSLLNMQVVDADFPSAPEQKEQFLRTIRGVYPDGVQVMSLAALENNLAAIGQHQKGAAVIQNTPPQILVATRPTVLVNVDGEPVYQPVPNTSLERVINTRALLLRDKQGKHYLHVLNGYLTAPKPDGPWEVGTAPFEAVSAEKFARENSLDLLEAAPGPGAQPQLTTETAPHVHVATAPTELLAFDGEPDYVPIPGTDLLYATNTTGNVFKSLKDQYSYVLLAGRWFKAPNLQGPWQVVQGTDLPQDFSKIPDSSPKENAKASVPGTPQSREAVIANSIPTSAGIRKGATMSLPQIDGPPKLLPIAGTPLHYVQNSPTPIIQVDEKSWYACQDGVWYVATSLEGPWPVAEYVPAVIYSIPPSSPMHYVTYVRVYDSSADVVYQGYTPGYMGTVVTTDAVVVYGTGYRYSPWIGHHWYGGPVTYGMGWGPFWSPWTSWSYGYGFGWYSWGYYAHHHPRWGHYSYTPSGPYWGPYRRWAPAALSPYRNVAINTSANVYRPPVAARPVIRNVPVQPRPSAFASAFNSRTGQAIAGQTPNVRSQLPPSAAPVRTPTSDPYGIASRRVMRDQSIMMREEQRPITRGEVSRMRPPTQGSIPQSPVMRDVPQPRTMRVEPMRTPDRSSGAVPRGIEQRRRN